MLLCLALPRALYLYNDIVLAFVRLLTAGEDFLTRSLIPMLLKEKGIVKRSHLNSLVKARAITRVSDHAEELDELVHIDIEP